jgi:hypothetical protein
MDKETNNDELNTLHNDREKNNSSSSGESRDDCDDCEAGILRINLKTQNKIMNLSTNMEDNNGIIPIVTL